MVQGLILAIHAEMTGQYVQRPELRVQPHRNHLAAAVPRTDSAQGVGGDRRADAYESTLDDLTLLLDHSLIQFSDGDNYTFHDLLRPVAKDTFSYVEHHRLASSSQIRLQVAEHRMKEGCLAAIADSVLEANG